MKIKKNHKELFIATSNLFELQDEIIHKFKKKGLSVKINPFKKKLENENLIMLARNSNYIIAGTENYNKETLNKLPKLQYLFRLGSGTDNIDFKYLKIKKIKFKKSSITPEASVAELIIGYILSLLRKIHSSDQNLRMNKWKKEMGSLLYGKKVGIVGFGKIGKYLYKLLKAFGANVLINDIKFNKKKNIDLKFLLKESDIVTMNTSLKSSKKILDKKNLNLLKKDCILINTSRPEILDYKHLYNLLKKKKIQGAGLDVFDKEPYYGELKKLNNVILTPHIGSYSREIRSRMEIEALDAIQKLIL